MKNNDPNGIDDRTLVGEAAALLRFFTGQISMQSKKQDFAKTVYAGVV